MKATIEIDCTPEEARRALGLPDLTPIHDRYVAMMTESLSGSTNPEAIEAMVRNWGPMSEAGMTMWRRLFEAGAGRAGS